MYTYIELCTYVYIYAHIHIYMFAGGEDEGHEAAHRAAALGRLGTSA